MDASSSGTSPGAVGSVPAEAGVLFFSFVFLILTSLGHACVSLRSTYILHTTTNVRRCWAPPPAGGTR